jgi:hypothetical protein
MLAACSIHTSPGIGKSQRDVILFLSEYGKEQGEHLKRAGRFDQNLWQSGRLGQMQRTVQQHGYTCHSETADRYFSVRCLSGKPGIGMAFFLDQSGFIRASVEATVGPNSPAVSLNEDEKNNLRALLEQPRGNL